MKYRPENRIICMFLLLLCLLMAPVSSNAAYAPNGVDYVKEMLSPVSNLPAVELRMPFTVVQDPADGRYPVHIELTGLPADTACWLDVTIGESVESGALTSDGGPAGLWLRFDGATGKNTVEVSVYADETRQTLLYTTSRFYVYLTESLPYTAEDAASGIEPQTVSMTDREACFMLLFPKDTYTEYQVLHAVLLDENGLICGHSEKAMLLSDEVPVEDARYNGVFNGVNPYRIVAQQMEVTVSLHRALDPDSYTLQILDDQGKNLCTYENLLTCSEQPVVEVLSWSQWLTADPLNGEVAAVQLRLVGGNPEDFSVELWRDDTRLGVSEDWRVKTVCGWQLGSVVDYEIPLDEALEDGSGYSVRILCDQSVFGKLEETLPPVSAETFLLESQSACLESRWFASFVIPADGFVQNRLYRLELLENNHPVSTKLVTPDEKGWFDIDFTRADGRPLPLQEGCRYQVTISCWTPDGWLQCAATQPMVHRAINPSVYTMDVGQQVAVAASCVDLTPDGIWKVTLQGEKETLSLLESAKLHLVAADGGETTLSPQTVTYSYLDRCLTLSYLHDSTDFGWYNCSLVLEDKLLADQNGRALLSFGSEGCYGGNPLQALGVETAAGTLYYGVETTGGDLLPVTLQLYDEENGVQTLRWTAGEPPVLEDASIPASCSRKPVQAVAFADGIPALAVPNSYWFPQDTALSLAADAAQPCYVKVSCVGNGQAVLYCDGQPVTGDMLPPLSEIYVHAIPDAGYEVDSVQVNQTAMNGRSFLLAEDTQVDVFFRKRTPETFALTLEYDASLHNPEGGSVAVSTDRASVEEVITLTAAVQSGYVLDRLEVIMEDSETPVTLTPSNGGWQFSMPAEPVRILVAIRPLYRPAIQVEINNTYGTITAPETPVEGQTVTVTAASHPASQLARLELVYTINGEEKRVDLLPLANGNNAYFFVVPASDTLTLQADFVQPPMFTINCIATGQGAVTVSTGASIPTETVTLTVEPAEGYRLVKDSLQVQTVQNGVPQMLPLESGAEGYTFSMPWSDVEISAAFEPVPAAAPGGVVITPAELFAALGGSLNATMAEDGCTVRLVQSAELQQPLVFRGGEISLDVGQYALTTAPDMTGDALVVEADAALHITGTAAGGIIAEETAVYVCGGSLTVEGGSFSGTVGLEASAQSALHLRGGSFAGAEAALRLHCPVGDCLDPFVVACHPENGTQYDDQWVAQTTVADAVRFVQTQPAFADNYATAQTDPSNIITVTADVTNPTGDGLLLAALYGEQGQLIAAAVQPCVRGDEVQSITLCFGDDVHSGRLYLLDKTTYKPLAKDIPIKIQ
ncbi:MAG: hypothetical protein IJA56_04495 [Clostridia bacterium]|nr:hypothetical protein [Clostridia bacterium]